MNSTFHFFHLEIPFYGVFYFSGIFLAAFFAFLLTRKRLEGYDVVYSAVYTAIGGVIGAKLLFLLVSWRQIVLLKLSFLTILKGGFVFFGGLGGGIAGLWIYCRQFHLPFWKFADLYAIALPFGHAVGRIGCYFAGCCYGISYHGPFSVVYKETLGATPLNEPLFPVQLLEAFLLLLLSLVLFFLDKKKNLLGERKLSGTYCLAYSLIRLFTECFRADTERGIFFGVSTSGWISFVLFAFGLFIIVKKRRGKESQ